jgi:ribonuclease PH
MNMTNSKRSNNRACDQLREIKIETDGINMHAEGTCLISFGNTRVLCTASVDESRVPPFLRNTGSGWVTAEYSMLPRATLTRNQREVNRGQPSGRTQEIQRLIARSLRAAVDLNALGERQIIIDCDVLQADGGTRTAAITGGFVALCQAVKGLYKKGNIRSVPLVHQIAAVSCGIVGGQALLDLDYLEDSNAEVDANFVFTDAGKMIEIQSTAEGEPFSQEEFLSMLKLADEGVRQLAELQKAALGME